MSETHAPLWVYGSGALTLRFAPSALPRTFTVDGRTESGPKLMLGRRGWHVVTIDVPHLVNVSGRRIGLTIESLHVSR